MYIYIPRKTPNGSNTLAEDERMGGYGSGCNADDFEEVEAVLDAEVVQDADA